MEEDGVMEKSGVLYSFSVYDMDSDTVNHNESRIFYPNDEISVFIGNKLVVIMEPPSLKNVQSVVGECSVFYPEDPM